jgi:hypothetical protein
MALRQWSTASHVAVCPVSNASSTPTPEPITAHPTQQHNRRHRRALGFSFLNRQNDPPMHVTSTNFTYGRRALDFAHTTQTADVVARTVASFRVNQGWENDDPSALNVRLSKPGNTQQLEEVNSICSLT